MNPEARQDELVLWHDRHHAHLDEGLLCVVEDLMAVDVDAALERWAGWVVDLRAGLALEDQVILPAYRLLPTLAPQGRIDVVEGDHVLLDRAVAAVDAWCRSLQAQGASVVMRRREVALGLPLVYRLRGVLEHHGERERRHVYPRVAATLSPADRAAAIATLSRLAG
jgi:hypothetical protein